MTAGRRDVLITLERATTTQNEYGEEQATWAPVGKEWAARYFGRGDERRQLAMEQGSQPATFNLLLNVLTRSLTIRDRLNDGSPWDIVGISPDTPKRGEIELTAVRAA